MENLNTAEPVQVRVESDLADLIPTFVENRRKDLVALESHISQKNFDEIKRLGHTLKGICAPYGFAILGELAKELEDAAKSEDTDALKKIQGQMKYVVENHEIQYEEE